MLASPNFVILHVPDLDQAVRFYTDKLGFASNEAESIPGTYTQFQSAPNGATFSLLKQADDAPYRGVELWWDVADVDAAYTDLAARGVEVAQPPTDQPFGRTLAIKDPAGHTIYMLTPHR